MAAKKTLSTLEHVEKRRLHVAKYRRQGKTICEMSGILEVSKRTISNDVKANQAAMMERAAALRKEGGDIMLMDGLETYDDVKALHYGIMEQAGEKYKEEEISRRQYLGEIKLASEIILNAQSKKDGLLAKRGIYEGEKTTINIAVFNKFTADDWRMMLEHLQGDPEALQMMMDWLWAKGARPSIEGEYKELND